MDALLPPVASPGADLPVRAVLGELCESLASHRRAVLVAPPGSGKTTVVPLALADATGGRVLVAEPRRVAARAAARRMAEITGTRLGNQIGYTVRGDSRTSAGTRVEVVTTGVLVRRLQRDPELPGISTVVVDECHERHLDTELALGFGVDVCENLREDLRLVAASATAQAERLAGLLGDAPIVEAQAALHPIESMWAPPPLPVTPAHGLWVDPRLLDHVARTVATALRERDGDILVFLPGAKEITEVAKRLSGIEGADVLTLHGRQSGGEQDAALRPAGGRRVVLSSAVAESSLTVPGVRIVVDAGLAREPRTDHARGLDSLVTVPVSRAVAHQRAGRAAREAPGTVYRCWSAASHERLAAHPSPQLATADLTGFVLQLARWGGEIRLLDPIGHTARRYAETTLRSLGAIDETARITDFGARVADIPAHPRLARALLDGAARVGARRAAEVVAQLSGDRLGSSVDLTAEMRRNPQAAEARRLAMSLPKSLRDKPSQALPDDLAAACIVGLAFPERMAKHAGGRRYLMAAGTQAELPDASALHGVDWLAIADVDRQPGQSVARIRSAVPCDADIAVETAHALLHREREVSWRDGQMRAELRRSLGAIVLSRRPVQPESTELARVWREALRAEGLSLLEMSETAHQLRQRLNFCRQTLGEPWPDVSDSALLARLDDWLGPDLDNVDRIAKLRGLDVTSALRRLLDWRQQATLDELAPRRFRLPSGSNATVDYSDPLAPALEAKLQEFFGAIPHPRVADGRVPLVLRLLSPAGRPVAITGDLPAFWDTGYAQVRAEMRGRYPKHPWPVDPRSAEATARTKRR